MIYAYDRFAGTSTWEKKLGNTLSVREQIKEATSNLLLFTLLKKFAVFSFLE